MPGSGRYCWHLHVVVPLHTTREWIKNGLNSSCSQELPPDNIREFSALSNDICDVTRLPTFGASIGACCMTQEHQGWMYIISRAELRKNTHSYMHKCDHPRPNNFIPSGCLPLLSLLLFGQYQMPRYIFHLHQFLHLQYLSSDLRRMWEIHGLKSSMDTESF